ncbi:MAG: type II/IV secretion system ATPase subunit [Dehalococcoidia bacterium]|nr:type II/IV secretion system ATPase subunit [Dehalococcoidia bacterium]
MPRTLLPYQQKDPGSTRRKPGDKDELYRLLPELLQEACRENRHLWDYLCRLPVDEIPVPEYRTELKRAHSEQPYYNLIYPVGGGVFIHVYTPPSGGRPNYISVEPCLTQDLSIVLPEVEGRLVDEAVGLMERETDKDRTEALTRLVEKVCTVHRNGNTSTTLKLQLARAVNGKSRNDREKIHVTAGQMEALKYMIIRDKVGMGILEPMISDPYIEDISCSGIGPIFLEHKIFKSAQAAIVFESHEDIDDFVLRLSEQIRKPVTLRSPIVDATLPDGSRINIVFGREVSRRGSNFTIRKFSEVPLSIMELIEFGSLNYEMAAYLSMVIEDGMNVFVVGETASGKTTLMNALTTFMPQNHKIVSIEDTPELQVPHANWIREVSKNPAPGEKGAHVSMFELLKAALRQRPDVIIVGEIRGEEGNIAFGAMQTGHQVMSTFHASNVEKLIQRLTGHPINVPKTYMDNLNVVVCQNAVKLASGKKARRATSVNEIVGYDSVSNTFSYVEVFRWDPATDTFDFVGKRNSYLLEEKIAIRRGIPPAQKWKIYDQVERRKRILEKLHIDKGVSDFYELLKVLGMAGREGLF